MRRGLLVSQRTGSQETRHMRGEESEDGLAPPMHHLNQLLKHVDWSVGASGAAVAAVARNEGELAPKIKPLDVGLQ